MTSHSVLLFIGLVLSVSTWAQRPNLWYQHRHIKRHCNPSTPFRPLCGNDGYAYNNLCAFAQAQWINRGLRVRSDGECPHQHVVHLHIHDHDHSQLKPRYSCRCDSVARRVCGSNGRTYLNECALNCAKNNLKNLKLASFGSCQRSGKKPVNQECICLNYYSPVCGSDGVTYSNEKCLVCAQRKNNQLRKVSSGKCSVSSPDPVESGRPCACTRIAPSLCGSDGKRYTPCTLKCAQQKSKDLRSIGKISAGRCPAPFPNSKESESRESIQERGSSEASEASDSPESPSNESPSNESPSNESPSNESPSNESPSNESPSNENKSNEGQSNETPSSGSTSNESPSNESSSNESPSNESRSKESSSNESTSNESPSNEGTSNESKPSSESRSSESLSNESQSKERSISSLKEPSKGSKFSCLCTSILQEVCGSDGQTYRSLCYLKCARTKNTGLRQVSLGKCKVDSRSDSKSTSNSQEEPEFPSKSNSAENSVSKSGSYENKNKKPLPPLGYCACPYIYEPICGSDGLTYGNTCSLDCTKRHKKSLKKVSDGVCPQGRSAIGQLPPLKEHRCTCTLDWSPVCGSDNLTYGNVCAFNCARKKNKNLRKAQDGECPKLPKSKIDAEDVCACPLILAEVCGSDSKTYSNECSLNCAKKKNKDLTITLNKRCQEPVIEPRRQKCTCFANYNPVCGTDKVTYGNECQLNCAQRASAGQNIKLASQGRCPGRKG